MKIRPAIPADFGTWLKLVDGYNDDVLKYARAEWEGFFSAHPEAFCLVATTDEDDYPVAFLQYTFHHMCFKRGKICYISDLYVDPDYRRQGIARALLENMMALADQLAWWRVYWITEFDNPIRVLYDQLGIAEFVRYHTDRYN